MKPQAETWTRDMARPPVRTLIVGAGFIGKTHLEASRTLDSIEVVGVVDLSVAAAEAFAQSAGTPWFSDLDSAIGELAPDAAIVCTPPRSHLSVVRTCALQSVDVLCEKPLALDAVEAREIRQLVEEHRIRLLVGHVLRFWPEYRQLRAWIEQRTFGRVVAATFERLSPPPSLNSWMMTPEGGGAAIDLLIHDGDFVLKTLGAPQSLEARGRSAFGCLNEVQAVLRYDRFDVIVQASYLMPRSHRFRMRFHVRFEEAVVEMDYWREPGERLLLFADSEMPIVTAVEATDPFRNELQYFTEVIRDGGEFTEPSLEEALSALDLCTEICRRSLARGCSEDVALEAGSRDLHPP